MRPETCHCGRPVIIPDGMDCDRGMCAICDSVRCDAFMPDIGSFESGWKYPLRSSQPPSVPLPEPHQAWVAMSGPGEPHWEVRGTGLLAP